MISLSVVVMKDPTLFRLPLQYRRGYSPKGAHHFFVASDSPAIFKKSTGWYECVEKAEVTTIETRDAGDPQGRKSRKKKCREVKAGVLL